MVKESNKMRPVSRREATLNDLLDRLLNKGLMLYSDVVVTVSGIPLLGLNLRLALAGMSTMLRYGFMTDWDEAIRSSVQKDKAVDGPPLERGERVLFSQFASCWFNRGIYSAWQPGLLYLTDRRLLLYRQEPAETLLDIGLGLVSGVDTRQEPHFSGQNREEIRITLTTGNIVRLHCAISSQLLNALEKARDTGNSLNCAEPAPDSEKRIWYLINDPTGKYNWRPGSFYVREGCLCWRGSSGQGVLFQVASADVLEVEVTTKDVPDGPGGRSVMVLRYLGRLSPEKVYFAGEEEVLRPWVSLLADARRDLLET